MNCIHPFCEKKIIQQQKQFIDDVFIGDVFIGDAFIDDTIDKNGWGNLKIWTNAKDKDDLQMRAAGFLEGFVGKRKVSFFFFKFLLICFFCSKQTSVLTQHRIFQHASNLNTSSFPTEVLQFVSNEMNWLQQQIQLGKSNFWNQVSLTLTQIVGMAEGYQSIAPLNETLNEFDLIVLNMVDEIGDIMGVFGFETEPSGNTDFACFFWFYHFTNFIKTNAAFWSKSWMTFPTFTLVTQLGKPFFSFYFSHV